VPRALSVLVATLALVILGCGTGDYPPRVRFDGITYFASTARGLEIADGDLAQIGVAEEVGETPPSGDGIVFSLRGVDPRKIILMRAPEPQTDGPWLMMIGEGTLFGSKPLEPFESVPEVCPYFPNEAACD